MERSSARGRHPDPKMVTIAHELWERYPTEPDQPTGPPRAERARRAPRRAGRDDRSSFVKTQLSNAGSELCELALSKMSRILGEERARRLTSQILQRLAIELRTADDLLAFARELRSWVSKVP